MRIVLFAYSSCGSRAYSTLRALGQDVACVITHAPSPGEAVWFEPVADLARSDGVPVLEVSPHSARGNAPYVEAVERVSPEVILSAYFRSLIPPGVLRLAPKGAFNLHGSLLPRYRGRSPVNWVLIHGESETGMTLHHMTSRADAGDIVDQVRLEIGPDETAPELQARLDAAAEEILRRRLPEISSGTAPRRPQDPSRATYFGRRTPEDGRFDWSWPPRRIHNLVRAVTRPFPGAFADGEQGRLRVWRTRVTGGGADGAGRLEILESQWEPLPPQAPGLRW